MSKLLQKLQFSALPPDDFIRRLRCSVIGEGMLHPGNIFLLDYAIQHMPDNGAVVEIGAYGGLSTNLMVYLLDKHRRMAPFLGCDAWVYEGYHDTDGSKQVYIDGRSDVRRAEYMAYIKEGFIRACRLLSPHRLPHTCHLRSDDFFACWAANKTEEDVFGHAAPLGGPIAFAYIEGDHSYAAAKRDVENVARHLLPGGFILLDDSAKGLPFGSAELAVELSRDARFMVVRRNPNLLFLRR
jgi:hypothetical protein